MVDLEPQFAELVQRLSSLESVADQPKKFKNLDRELVNDTNTMWRHLELCKRIAALQTESGELDAKINTVLLDLAKVREQLASVPSKIHDSRKVESQEVLDYATRITKFTRASESQHVLPWPAEDMLRRGMLATFSIAKEEEPKPESAAPSPSIEALEAPIEEDNKISLDFDSD